MALTPRQIAARETLARRYNRMRQRLRETGEYDELACKAKFDRVILTSNKLPWDAFRTHPAYEVRTPVRLWNQDYRFATRIKGAGSIRELVVESERQVPWLAPFKITIEPRDKTGLLFEDLRSILELLPRFKIVLLEVAWDFPMRSIVDVAYVQKHGLFGKSWAWKVGTNPVHDSWGRRKGSKFVRSYAKWELDVHRTELELHARFLRRHRINDIFDFQRLVTILPGRHIFFARLDMRRLNERLRRSGFKPSKRRQILNDVAARESDLCATLRYLRRRVHLKNVRRLLVPLPMNRLVLDALKELTAKWPATPARLEKKK